MMRITAPDFLIDGWRLQDRIDFFAFDPETGRSLPIGCYNYLYINQRTGELGNDIKTKNGYLLSRIWEKQIFSAGGQTTLFYAQVYSNGKYKIFRLENALITAEIQIDGQRNIAGIKLILKLIAEREIRFFISLSKLNTP